MNIKDEVYKIWMQIHALHDLSEGMDAVMWTDETPMGFEIFLKGIDRQLSDLYKAIPGEKVGSPSLSGASKSQKKRRGNGHEEK